MIILLVVIGIALGCGLMGAIVGIMIDRWRRESRQLDTDIAEYEKRGRHAKTQPRTSLVRDEAPFELARLPLKQERKPGAVQMPSRWYAEQIAARSKAPSHVAASDIAPVVLPEPGSYPPQAGRDSGDGTLTFPKIRLELATTGEIRAIGDEMVAAIEAAGEAS